MRVIFSEISDMLKNVIKTFFASDLEVMSDEVKRILANPEDAQKYKEAVKEIESGEKKSITITLSNNEQLTLIH